MVSVCRHWAELLSALLHITWKGEGSDGKANDSQVGVTMLAIKSFPGLFIPPAWLLFQHKISRKCQVQKCIVLTFDLVCKIVDSSSVEAWR